MNCPQRCKMNELRHARTLRALALPPYSAGLATVVLLIALPALSRSQEPPWKSQGIIDNLSSPYAKVHSVPVRAVTMGEGFWAARMRTNAEKSVPSLLQLLEAHGVVDNFRRLSGRKKADRKGPLYTDSDIYKWMEAASLVLQSQDEPRLRATLASLSDEVLAAQEPSGYLNTYYVDDRATKRFSEMYRSHELYCLGHLLQAGIAYYRATGDMRLLEGGRKYADYLVTNFGPDKRPALTGHPELEMALVELYRVTRDRKYLEFAGYLLSGVERERLKLTDAQIRYLFSGIPFTSREEFVGHAVRALYAASGATDYTMETGDPLYRQTLQRLWRDLAERKMYITGGVGARSAGESLGGPYELPNASAYAESCAAIANFMWNWRMLAMTGEARFADVMERALYNGINSGMSLDGTLYCYTNPLESHDERIRNPWYDTTCCPPNLERTFAALPGYLYGTSREGVYVHLFHSSTLTWHLEDGTGLVLKQQTGYPWNGQVGITVDPAAAREFTLFVRIPGWAHGAQVTVNGEPCTVWCEGEPAKGKVTPGEYFALSRRWHPGDRVTLDFDMTPQLVQADPRVADDRGRVAVERGPLVYCLEQTDQPGPAHAGSVSDVSLRVGAGQKFEGEFRPEMLGGIYVLRHPGMASPKTSSHGQLYQAFQTPSSSPLKPVELTLIPYYAWANRGLSSMEVWIPYVSQ